MRSLFAPALMVSALALSPALVSADDSAGQATGQTAGQAGDAMTESGSLQNEDVKQDELRPLETAGQRGDFLTEQTANQVLSESYIGASVLIGTGEETESVGTISQLIFDDNDAITGAVVDVGGFLGIGAKPVGLQWSALEQRRAEDTVAFTTTLTRADFENAAEYRDLDDQRSEEMLELQEQQPATN